jgi:hypothetical protein
VKFFQKFTGCPTRDGSVDKPTQDYIIAINNVDTNKSSRIYLKWVQESLQLAGFGNGFAADGSSTKQFKDAIRKFQAAQGHKSIDGVVGYRTETDLAKKAPSLSIPGYFPGGVAVKPPVDPVVEREDDYLKSNMSSGSIDEELKSFIHHYLLELADNPLMIIMPDERKATICMLKKFQKGIDTYRTTDAYDYLKAQEAQNFAIGKYPEGVYVPEKTTNALAELRNSLEYYRLSIGWAKRFVQFKRDMAALYLRVDDGIKYIWYHISNSSGTLSGPYLLLHDWYEEKHSAPRSIMSCFKGPS